MEIKSNIGGIIRTWRRNNNKMSRAKLSLAIAIQNDGDTLSDRQIFRIEKGLTKSPSFKNIARLASVVDTIDFGNLLTIGETE